MTGVQTCALPIFDGRILKRGGRLTHVDAPELTTAAQTALRNVLSRADADARTARAAASPLTAGTCC